MNRHLIIGFIGLLGGCSGLWAQNANPLSSELKQSYTTIKTNLLLMAEKMPDESYTFRPTPDVETFGRRVAHITDANMRTCAGLRGERKSVGAASKTTKAELLPLMKESFAYCDSVFESLTDQAALEMVSGAIGSPPSKEARSKLSTLWNIVRHSNEMYGYMSVYLRLKGVVPPSSEAGTGR